MDQIQNALKIVTDRMATKNLPSNEAEDYFNNENQNTITSFSDRRSTSTRRAKKSKYNAEKKEKID